MRGLTMDTTPRYGASPTGTHEPSGPEPGRVPTLVFSILSGLCALPPLGLGLWLLAAYVDAPNDPWASLVGAFGLIFMAMGLGGVAGLWLGLHYRFRNPQAGLVFAVLGFVIALLPCLFGVAWWSPGQP